jgi:predicted dinucleotide-binding enzyme
MKVAIIGSGNVGGALAQNFIKAGHTVIVGAKFPLSEKSIQLATKIGEDRFAAVENAAKQSEVIIITTAIDAVITVAKQLGDCSNKVIIDATNSVFKKPEPYANGFEALKTETNCQDIVKCFNSTGFENMLNPVYEGEGIDMFVAGSSARGKEVAKQLSLDIGFANCYDFGGDDKVPLLEQFALSWINLAIIQKHGRDLAFKLIKR